MIKIKLGIMSVLIFFVISCHSRPPARFVLSDFESEADLDRVQWRCHTLCSLSEENATHGNKSLQLELYPSAYPGIAFELPMHNWSKFEILSLDIFNPQDESIFITMRIDDEEDYPDYEDRYNHSFTINPGMNHLSIPLNSMSTSSTGRRINLKSICRCLIFMPHPRKKHLLYMDHVFLT